MKKVWIFAGTLAIGIGSSLAQAPAGAPAGANGICKDGTYSTAPAKSGACAGHKGVQTWYAAAPAKSATPSVMAPTPAAAKPTAMPTPTAASAKPASMPAPTPAPGTAASTSKKAGPAAAANAKAAAPGGGPGLVWVNTASNVYHCNGDTYYGKTKAGAYMSEADAKAKGAHGERGQSCTGK